MNLKDQIQNANRSLYATIARNGETPILSASVIYGVRAEDPKTQNVHNGFSECLRHFKNTEPVQQDKRMRVLSRRQIISGPQTAFWKAMAELAKFEPCQGAFEAHIFGSYYPSSGFSADTWHH
jgi:hypothetical protein